MTAKLSLIVFAAALACAQQPFQWPEGKRVAVSLSFDDARASQITAGLDLFAKHNARATFYVNPRNMDKQLEGWKRAVALGHEIGNHSTSHPCSANFPWSRRNALEDYTLDRLEADFDTAHRDIQRLLGVSAKTFAYPCGSKYVGRGQYTQSYVPLIAGKYLAGRGFRDESANDPVHADFAQLLGVDSDGLAFEQMLAIVKKGDGGWIVFAGHEIGSAGEQTTRIDALERFLAYAKDPANGIWLDRVDTIAEYIRARRAPSELRAFTGATVWDATGRAPIPDAVILVRDGRIEAVGPASQFPVPAGAQTIDLRGKYVIPGLVSAHVHVTGDDPRRVLGVFARYGITTVWSLGGETPASFRARDAQHSPALDRARIFVAGDVLTGNTPEEARAMAARVAAARPDVLKIRVDDQLGTARKMPPEVYSAVIEEAHAAGLRLAAHIYSLEDAKSLLRAGADFIAHSVRDREIDDEFIALMKSRAVAYCPTFTRELSTYVYESRPAFFDDPFFLREADPAVVAQLQEPARQQAMRQSRAGQAYKAALPTALRNLKRAHDAGLLIAMGTDSGAFPERFPGYFEHLELEMMADAGLIPEQILLAATARAASAMRIPSIGSLAKGNWADLLVLDQNPLADIRHTRSIHSVWIAGNPVTR